jgi:hypothetical protein
MSVTTGLQKMGEADSKATRKYGSLIRVSDQFIEAMRDVTGFEKVSTAEFADAVLLPIVQKRYREGVIRKAKQLEGKP